MLKFFVDADACPYAEEIIAVLQHFDAEAIFVANRELPRLQKRNKVCTILTGLEFSAVDDWILQAIRPLDVLLTADLELSKKSLQLGAKVFSYRCKELNFENIHEALALHQFALAQREEKGPKHQRQRSIGAVGRKQRSQFKNEFHNFLARQGA